MENKEINWHCRCWAGAWVSAGQWLGLVLLVLGNGLGWQRVEELKLATGRNERVQGPTEGREEQRVEMGKEEK